MTAHRPRPRRRRFAARTCSTRCVLDIGTLWTISQRRCATGRCRARAAVPGSGRARTDGAAASGCSITVCDANADLADGTSLLQALLVRLPASLTALRELNGSAVRRRAAAACCRALLQAPALARRATWHAGDAGPRSDRARCRDFCRRRERAHAAGARRRAGSATIVQALLDRGVDPNARDRHGRTPLFDCAGSARRDQAESLIRC